TRRIREVDEPRPRRATRGGLLRELEDDGNGPQRLREAARPRRLLTDAAESRRDRLVGQARGLSSDPELDHDEVGALECLLAAVGERQPPTPSRLSDHALGESSDDAETF